MQRPSQVVLKGVNKDGETIDKVIYELSEAQAAIHKSIGRPVGLDMDHCLYLGFRYAPQFRDRVCGYRYIEVDRMKDMFEKTIKKEYITIEFFECKNSSKCPMRSI